MDELVRRSGLLKTLTPRQLEILRLTCDGMIDREIADRLVLSARTIKFHKAGIYERLGVDEMQQAPRQREIGKFCQALAAAEVDAPAAPSLPEPEPPQPTLRALAAVEEDNKTLAKQRLADEEREAARRRAVVPLSGTTGAQPWTDPVPVPIEIAAPRTRPVWPLVAVSGVALLLAIGLIATLLNRRGEPRIVERIVERVVTATPAAPVLAQSTGGTPTAAPTATAIPTPTPTPVPTPQAVTAATFVVATQAAGCHADPSAGAAAIAQHAAGAVLTVDQVIRLPDGVWHRESAQRCWLKTQPGPFELFTDQGQAQAASRRFAPPGTVLYLADWSAGPNGWPQPRGVNIVRGQLVAQDAGVNLIAPYEPGASGIADYAVEAEAQLFAGDTDPFGLVFRTDYSFRIAPCCFRGYNTIVIRYRDNDIGGGGFTIGGYSAASPWHLYRVEVEGNRIRLKIDGVLVGEALDNRQLSGGTVGIFLGSAGVNVRLFRIIKL